MEQKNYDKIHRINCLASDLDAIYHQAALKLGMSDSVMYILYLLHERGGECPLYDICKVTGIRKQTINSAVQKLEKEGITCRKVYNGRTKIVCLTENGAVCVEKTVARLFEAECKALSTWTEEEVEQYLYFMEKYNVSLRKQLEELK